MGRISQDLNKQPILLVVEDLETILHHSLRLKVEKSDLDLLISIGVLPIYLRNGHRYALRNDVMSIVTHFYPKKNEFSTEQSIWAYFGSKKIYIGPHTFLIPAPYNQKKFPAYSAALKNIFGKCDSIQSEDLYDDEKCIEYLGGSKLLTFSKSIANMAMNQMERANKLEQTTQSIFSRSASYMGSKKALGGFINEAIFPILPKQGVVIDLMCGSGVASAAFSNNWRTIASDSQIFCRTLAKIHGNGFDMDKAKHLLTKILPSAEKHFQKFCSFFNDAIVMEENCFYRDTDYDLQIDYASFIASFPTITSGGSWGKWKPSIEVESRRRNRFLEPYCLFTSYFSNVFFGLRQCVEIDSLKYAIDQMLNGDDKLWAMGALITTVSAISSTYGGHFAQPLVKDIKNVSLEKLSNIISKRSVSITHEYSIRLLNLSEQSQNQAYPVEIVQGPWKNTLNVLEHSLEEIPVLVYLDAPYKREEYSRYYHVLETLCLYNYPSCTGLGLIPNPGERFRSEFFTRTTSQLNKIFCELICEILTKGWMCAWSYSNSGAADICDIIEEVNSKISCGISSYAVPAMHISQGGAKHKSVTEYLIIFTNNQPTDINH